MKTERRHELQTNDLAKFLNRQADYVRPYARLIVGVVIAVVAVVGGYYFMTSQQASKVAVGWQDYYQAFNEQDPERLQQVAERHGDTTAGMWARLSAGEFELAQGASELFRDRREAEVALDRAKSHFQEVEKMAQRNSVLLQRARLGLAQVYESQGELAEARQYYQQVVEQGTDPMLVESAERRLRQLDDPGIEEWYAWFREQEPRVAPPTGMPGMPATPHAPGMDLGEGADLPFDLEDLPDRPDLSFPAGDPAPSDPALPELPLESPEDPAAAPQPTPQDASQPTDTEPTDTEPADAEPAQVDP